MPLFETPVTDTFPTYLPSTREASPLPVDTREPIRCPGRRLTCHGPTTTCGPVPFSSPSHSCLTPGDPTLCPSFSSRVSLCAFPLSSLHSPAPVASPKRLRDPREVSGDGKPVEVAEGPGVVADSSRVPDDETGPSDVWSVTPRHRTVPTLSKSGSVVSPRLCRSVPVSQGRGRSYGKGGP